MRTVLYHYDPLSRLIQTAGIQLFYNMSRMTTEIQGAVKCSVFQVGDELLAESLGEFEVSVSNLLGTDRQRSVLHTVKPDKNQLSAYNVYGHRPADSGVSSLLGFNGERADPLTGHYLLGNGYRAFNPVLMRFNSPDSWSPFGWGGINSYAYCGNDPVNRNDETGHMYKFKLPGWGRPVQDARQVPTRVPSAAPSTSIAPPTPHTSVKTFNVSGLNFNDLGDDASAVKGALIKQSEIIGDLRSALQTRNEELQELSKLIAKPLFRDTLRTRTLELSSISTSSDHATRHGYALKDAYREMKKGLSDSNATPAALQEAKEAYDYVYAELRELGVPVLSRKNKQIRNAP